MLKSSRFDADANQIVQAGNDLRSFTNEATAASKHKIEEQGLVVVSRCLRVDVVTEVSWEDVRNRGLKVHATEDKV